MVITRAQVDDLAEILEIESFCHSRQVEEALREFERTLQGVLSTLLSDEDAQALLVDGAVWWTLLALITDDDELEDRVGKPLACRIRRDLYRCGESLEDAFFWSADT